MGLKAHKAILQNFHLPVWVITSQNIPLFQHSNIPVIQRHKLHPFGVHQSQPLWGRILTIFSPKRQFLIGELKFVDMLKRKRALLTAFFNLRIAIVKAWMFSRAVGVKGGCESGWNALVFSRYGTEKRAE